MTRTLSHVRRNLIAYLALFVALGGSSYAAVSLPRGSVGPAQLNRHLIGGYVLAWAHVSRTGHVYSGSPGATAYSTGTPVTPPSYIVRWRGVKLPARCAPLATIGITGSGSSGVTSMITTLEKLHGAPNQVDVSPRNASGQRVPAEFYLAVIC